jgi:hypothetical protein
MSLPELDGRGKKAVIVRVRGQTVLGEQANRWLGIERNRVHAVAQFDERSGLKSRWLRAPQPTGSP